MVKYMAKMVTVPLSTIAHGRSGDKGNHVNIGLIAHQMEWFPLLKQCITPHWLKSIFSDMTRGDVEVFPVPGIGGINCVMKESLQGGGTVSLRKDAQGKMLGQVILQAEIRIDAEIARELGVPIP